ncbi:hypothetical protein OSB04_023266 [Centaurea solstitialis]|uniref:Uncharacterized protein n=1 Tax=Centaurea solstitialis TaxID=347529 RepID=A0AA38WAW6_9ASTR|nr:hypothetical protein OSB04_023266 [Centaurea solstitialis]
MSLPPYVPNFRNLVNRDPVPRSRTGAYRELSDYDPTTLQVLGLSFFTGSYPMPVSSLIKRGGPRGVPVVPPHRASDFGGPPGHI